MKQAIFCTLLLIAAAHAGEPITDFTYPWADKPAPRTEVTIRNANDALHFTFSVDDPDIAKPDFHFPSAFRLWEVPGAKGG